jgi:hypothetical protein
MADPVNMVVSLLQVMRIENAALHEQTRGLIRALEGRLAAVEQAAERGPTKGMATDDATPICDRLLAGRPGRVSWGQ